MDFCNIFQKYEFLISTYFCIFRKVLRKVIWYFFKNCPYTLLISCKNLKFIAILTKAATFNVWIIWTSIASRGYALDPTHIKLRATAMYAVKHIQLQREVFVNTMSTVLRFTRSWYRQLRTCIVLVVTMVDANLLSSVRVHQPFTRLTLLIHPPCFVYMYTKIDTNLLISKRVP